jgi:hypothetical protein
MKQLFLLMQAAAFCYFGYLTVSIYMKLNNDQLFFRPDVPEDWMVWILSIGCFGFAIHSLLGLRARINKLKKDHRESLTSPHNPLQSNRS